MTDSFLIESEYRAVPAAWQCEWNAGFGAAQFPLSRLLSYHVEFKMAGVAIAAGKLLFLIKSRLGRTS